MIDVIIKSVNTIFTKFMNPTSELENYIRSKNPKSVAEIEHYTKQYTIYEFKRNGFFYVP